MKFEKYFKAINSGERDRIEQARSELATELEQDDLALPSRRTALQRIARCCLLLGDDRAAQEFKGEYRSLRRTGLYAREVGPRQINLGPRLRGIPGRLARASEQGDHKELTIIAEELKRELESGRISPRLEKGVVQTLLFCLTSVGDLAAAEVCRKRLERTATED